MEKLKKYRLLLTQVLFVVIAFALMATLSSIFVSNMLIDYLRREADIILSQIESHIISELREPETLMLPITNDVRGILLSGGTREDVIKYYDTAAAQLRGKTDGFIFDGFQGYFYAFDVPYITDTGWEAPDDFDATVRPWYLSAIEADGEIAHSPVYMNVRSLEYQITFVSLLKDDEGAPLGVVAMDMSLANIMDYVVNMRLTDGGYGFLTDENYHLFAHPDPTYMDRFLGGISPGHNAVVEQLRQGQPVTEFDNYNYQNARHIFYCRQMENGWALGLMIPWDEYYHDYRNMVVFLCLLGAGLTAAVSAILIQLDRRKRKLERELSINEARMREADEYTRLMFDRVPMGCMLWNKKQEIVNCNQKAYSLLELEYGIDDLNERFHGLSPEFQPSGERSKDKASQMLTEAFEEGYVCGEWMHQLPNKEPLPCEMTLIRLRHGDEFFVAAYIRDLRQHKAFLAEIERTQQELTRARDAEKNAFINMSNILNGVDAMICVTDPETDELIFINDKMREVFGVDADYSGQRCYRALRKFDKRCDFCPCNQLALEPESEVVWEREDALLKRIYLFYSKYIKWPASGKDVHIQHSVDITDIRQAQEQLREARNIAESANRAKSNFLASMSHEMRTPLTAVIGLTELTLKTAQLDDETHTNLVKVYRAGETLLLLINDILDISKIEADKFVLNPKGYDVPSMLNDTITQSIMYIESKPIKFVLDIREDLPSRLHGDELRVKQILNNLLTNAFKFTKEGTVELGIRHERDGDSVWLTAWVRDTGAGIRPEGISRLFTTYSKMEEDADRKSVNRRTEGTGLGLSISKKAAEMMDGSIEVESQYGKGSLFTVRLRQKYVGESTIGPIVVENLKNFHYTFDKFKRSSMSYINLSYAKVLVVDDNATNLDVAKGLMSLYGMEIDCALGGREAVDAIRDGKVRYNAVFMDHMMPEIDGIEATRMIRELDGEYAKTVPIIALTANAVVGNEEMFLNRGFQAFIAKPIDLAHLDDVLHEWVRDKDAEALLPDKMIKVASRGQDEERILGEGIPGLDVGKGISRFGSEEAYIGVIRSYAKNTKPLLESIKGVSAEGLAKYAITVHGIRGSSFGIFAQAAGEEAEALEMAAKDGDIDLVSRGNPGFIQNISRLIADIDSALENAGLTETPAKDTPDEALLARLLAACKIYDIDEIDSAMAEIEKFEYTSDGGLAAWLRESLDKGKYSDVRDRLEAI